MRTIPDFLAEAIKNGKTVLFTGAGFSLGATNQEGTVPSSDELKALLLKECGINDQPGKYNLIQTYSIAARIKGEKHVKQLMKKVFSGCEPTKWQKLIASYLWFRIYSTNIDDALEHAVRKRSNGRTLSVINGTGPAALTTDGPIQVDYIKLHGTCDGQSELIMGFEEYARSAISSYWLTFFAGDFETRHVVFIGASLQDPDLWHHIESRKNLAGIGLRERPVSFVVSPDADGPLSFILRDLNIEPIPMSGEDFAHTLEKELGAPNSVEAFVRKEVPFAFQNKELLEFPNQDKFLFERMYKPVKEYLKVDATGYRSAFFLGSEPTWIDIVQERDAQRELEKVLIDSVNSESWIQGAIIQGPAGTGKTTLLMRVAERMSVMKDQCYWFIGGQYPNLQFLQSLIRASKEKMFLFVDNLGEHYRPFDKFLRNLKQSDKEKIFIFGAGRKVAFYDHVSSIEKRGFRMYPLERLKNAEIPRMIAVLKRDDMLGKLKGKRPNDQFKAFELRARKSLLVALREATLGEGFISILKDEYDRLRGHELKTMYTAVALAHMTGLGLPRHTFASFLLQSGIELKKIKPEYLSDVLPALWTTGLLKTRHRVVAEIVCNEIAGSIMLKKVLTILLKVVSPSANMSYIARAKSPDFKVYKKLITYEFLSNCFPRSRSLVEDIYFNVKNEYSNDPHYWLHYGCLCVDMKDFDRAHTFFLQSLALGPLLYTSHQIGRLFLLKSDHASTVAEAKRFYIKGYQELDKLLDNEKSKGYSYHSLLSLLTDISKRWGRGKVFPIKNLEKIATTVTNDTSLRMNRRVNIALKKAIVYLKVA